MQAVPQSLSGQLIPQGSLTVLPQGTKLSTNIPIAQLAGAMQVTGKIPLRAMHPGSIKSASGSGGHRNLPAIIQKGSVRSSASSAAAGAATPPATVTVTAIQHGQPIPLQLAQSSNNSGGSQPIILTATNRQLVPSPLTMKTLSTAPNEQMEATDLSTKAKPKTPVERKAEQASSTMKLSGAKEQSSKVDRQQTNGKTASQNAEVTDKDSSSKESTHGKGEGQNNEPNVEDMEASLVWNNGVGMLPGSDLKVSNIIRHCIPLYGHRYKYLYG